MKSIFQKTALVMLISCSTLSTVAYADDTSDPPPDSNVTYKADMDTYGKYIAREAITLYYQRDTDDSKYKEPAYAYRGIMISGFESSIDNTGIPNWAKPITKVPKLSLSFWTIMTTGKTGNYGIAAFNGNGYMLWPTSIIKELSSNAKLFEQNFACAYAADANTVPTAGNGCYSYHDQQPTCQSLGIKNVQDYMNIFKKDGVAARLAECGFLLGISSPDDKEAFDTAMQLQRSGGKNGNGKDEDGDDLTKYNEVVIAGWPTDELGRIPLFGFFYLPHDIQHTTRGSIDKVRSNQQAFYNKSKIFAPILRVTGESFGKIKFEYIKDDQSPQIITDAEGNKNLVNVIADINK